MSASFLNYSFTLLDAGLMKLLSAVTILNGSLVEEVLAFMSCPFKSAIALSGDISSFCAFFNVKITSSSVATNESMAWPDTSRF